MIHGYQHTTDRVLKFLLGQYFVDISVSSTDKATTLKHNAVTKCTSLYPCLNHEQDTVLFYETTLHNIQEEKNPYLPS
jgi:hypothetical protein